MIEFLDVSFDGNKTVPFEFELSEDCEILIRTLPSLADFAESFEKRYIGNYFSRNAIDEIRKNCYHTIVELGFKEDISSEYCIFEYSSDGIVINPKLIRPDSKIINRIEKSNFDKKILFDVRDSIRIGGIASVTLDGNTIISAAATNMPINKVESMEITTETAVGYRGMGLSASNVSLLFLELQKREKSAVYKCRSTNRASIAVAEKVGLRRTRVVYRYLGIK